MEIEVSKGTQLLGVKLESCDYNRDGNAFYAYFNGFPGTDVEVWKEPIKNLIRKEGFPLSVADDWQLTLAKDFLWEHRYYLGSAG